jgi:uncharacterized membrane protein HdeD (DUF308 family)
VSTTVREDEGGAPALVGIAAIIGFAKAILEGGFGLIALAASDVIDSSFAGVAVVYAIVFAIASYLLLRGNRIGLWTTVALSVLGLAGAVIYLFYAEDAAFLTALVAGGMNALVLYLLLGTRSGREYFGRA